MRKIIQVGQYDSEYSVQDKLMKVIRENVDFYNQQRKVKIIIIEIEDLE